MQVSRIAAAVCVAAVVALGGAGTAQAATSDAPVRAHSVQADNGRHGDNDRRDHGRWGHDDRDHGRWGHDDRDDRDHGRWGHDRRDHGRWGHDNRNHGRWGHDNRNHGRWGR